MPIGCISLVPLIVDDLMQRRPATVLDLGIGMGFYGAAIRQWLDLGIAPWKTTLIGVEGFSSYRSACWNLYDEVIETSIELFLFDDTREWDAILLLDVLEHFEKDCGLEILRSLYDRLTPAGRLYVGTPAVWMPQEAAYGNEFERHRSLWTADDLRECGFSIQWEGEPDRFGNQMLLAVSSRSED